MYMYTCSNAQVFCICIYVYACMQVDMNGCVFMHTYIYVGIHVSRHA